MSASAVCIARPAALLPAKARGFTGRAISLAKICVGAPSRTTVVAAVIDAGVASAPAVPQAKVKGKTAIVTGGSQGCGRETALSLARDGYNVVVIARQPDRLQAVADEVLQIRGNANGAARAIPTDITSPESVAAMVAEVAASYEEVSLLICNAGACMTAPFEETTEEDWEWQLQTNFMGAVRITKGFMPALRKAKGAVVFVNSFGGIIPLKNMTAYSASKFALSGFAEALRAEAKADGVHVCQVHPGVINSDFLERAKFTAPGGKEAMQKTLETMPGVQTPAEIARAVVEAAANRGRAETVVGPMFQAAVAAYRLTGANPFAAI